MKNRTWIFGVLIAIVANGVVGFFQESRAELITFIVEGEVIGFDGPPQSPFELGQSYSATYTFESETVGTSISGGGKDYGGAVISSNFRIGSSYEGTLADSASTNIQVSDNWWGHTDVYTVTLNNMNAPPIQTTYGPVNPSKLTLISLEDYLPPTALSSDELLLTPPTLSDFENHFWNLEFESEESYHRIRGNVLSVSVVPEPISSTLFIIGGGMLGFRRFIKKFMK